MSDRRANQFCNESSRLLQHQNHHSSPHSFERRHSNRVTIHQAALERDVRPEECTEPGAKNGFLYSCTLFLSLALAAAALLLFRSSLPGIDVPYNYLHTSTSQVLLSELVFAPTVADSTTTFQGLAKSMIPSWYQQTLSIMPIFTPNVSPGDVYKARKILLKTRDLLDVFSPVYPKGTKIVNGSSTNVDDMWLLIRHYLNWGYVSVGEFQDLYNAHVLYTQQQMEEKRNVVLQWKAEFAQFRVMYDGIITDFLLSPATGSNQHEESHLFWQNAASLPSGSDLATPCLQLLGSIQLEQVVTYLASVYPYTSVLDEEAHQHYHNLRKQLRSVADEFELFGNIMFPMTPATVSAMELVNRARKLLGDINDDWTAYTIYVENDEYCDEQERLAARIDAAWDYFIKIWVPESDFEGAMHNLLESLTCDSLALDGFLKRRKRHPTAHIVIGNEAGDADSIVSAITLSFIESSQEAMHSTPIISIPRVDLATQRPEVCLLLKLAGISNATNDLLFVDDPLIVHDPSKVRRVTLVDHNVLAEHFRAKNWTVVEIVDHHQDEGKYLDTCSGNARTVAFVDEKALVASACTLVAERLKQVWLSKPYPPSLGVLLIGVILLDSVNLSSEVGKVTERDRDAVDDLVKNTDWEALPEESQLKLGMTLYSVLDTTAFFYMLQNAKYDSSFWNSLSVRDALRLDYKDFSYEGGKEKFGVSTVLMPMKGFLLKEDVVEGILHYMSEIGAAFLGIMFAYEDDSHLVRQLALCGANGFPVGDVVDFLHKSGYYRDPLNLEETKDPHVHKDDEFLSVMLFDQRNIKPSRKQIGPILLDYFEATEAGGDADIDTA